MLKKILILIFTILITISHFSIAAAPDSYSLYNEYIDITLKDKTYDIFLPYGNQYLTNPIDNTTVGFELNKDSLEIVPGSVKDYFITDELLNLDQNLPKNKYLDCSLVAKYRDTVFKSPANFGIPIPQALYTVKNMNEYGPQSLTTTSSLTAGNSGCIGFTVKASRVAKSGDLIEIKYNQNKKFSTSFEEINRPGLSTLAIVLTDGKSSCDNTKGEIYINSKCVQKCENNQVLDYETASCTNRERVCFVEEDNVGGQCLQKCIDGFYREANSVCKNPREISNIDQIIIYSKNNIQQYWIYVGSVLLASVAIFSILTFLNRPKK